MRKCWRANMPNQDGEHGKQDLLNVRSTVQQRAERFLSSRVSEENEPCLFLPRRKWESPLLHGLSVLPALHDLLDDVRLHFLWVSRASSTCLSPPHPLRPFTPLSLPSDWRIHCATTYAKDGFWLYLTQIASCSPWMFWMFLNSVFHFMWVAVLIMCQLYQVCVHVDTPPLKTYLKKKKTSAVELSLRDLFCLSQIAALGITTNERMNARRYKHFKVTATSIESPFK